MKFAVPRSQSSIHHFDVYPELPRDGLAQPWRVVDNSPKCPVDVDRFDIIFSLSSSKQERQAERLILVFNLAEAVQTEQASWRFVHGGVMYCEGAADYLDGIAFETSSDGKILTARIKSLVDIDQDFQFSFLALRRDNKSGECQVYSSADPGGSIRRLH